MNHWIEKERYYNQTRLVDEHEVNDQLKQKKTGIQPESDGENINMTERLHQDNRKISRWRVIIRKAGDRSWDITNPGNYFIGSIDIRKIPRSCNYQRVLRWHVPERMNKDKQFMNSIKVRRKMTGCRLLEIKFNYDQELHYISTDKEYYWSDPRSSMVHENRLKRHLQSNQN